MEEFEDEEEEEEDDGFPSISIKPFPVLPVHCHQENWDSGPYARYDGENFRCKQCGRVPSNQEDLLQAEKFFGQLAEQTFVSGHGQSGHSPGGGFETAMGQVKMVKKEFVRHALHLAFASQQVLGSKHWIVKLAHIFVVDLMLSKLENSQQIKEVLLSNLVFSLWNLWQWLDNLNLPHGPAYFIGTRVAKLHKFVFGPQLENAVVRHVYNKIDELLTHRDLQVEIIPFRTMLIEGTMTFG